METPKVNAEPPTSPAGAPRSSSGSTDLEEGIRLSRALNWWLAIILAALIGTLIWYFNPGAYKDKPSQAITFVISLFAGFLLTFMYTSIRLAWRDLNTIEAASAAQIVDADAALEKGDASIKPAWDRATATLDRYWQRNTSQNSLIFLASVIMSILGFVVMLVGVISALTANAVWWVPSLVTLSGILTQFIGATFLILYRSTVQQMMRFNSTLERINVVGMAWFIAQAIDDSTPDGKTLKNETCKALALSIVAQSADASAGSIRPSQS